MAILNEIREKKKKRFCKKNIFLTNKKILNSIKQLLKLLKKS